MRRTSWRSATASSAQPTELGDPGREFHVLDLVAAENPRPGTTGVRPRRGSTTTGFDDAGVLLDDQARTAHRRRLLEIEDDIDEARSTGDLGRAEQAEAERDFLVRERSAASGVGAAAARPSTNPISIVNQGELSRSAPRRRTGCR